LGIGGGARRSGGSFGLDGIGRDGWSLRGIGTGVLGREGVLTGASVLAKSPRNGFFGLFIVEKSPQAREVLVVVFFD
jgi:hypothetical protein